MDGGVRRSSLTGKDALMSRQPGMATDFIASTGGDRAVIRGTSRSNPDFGPLHVIQVVLDLSDIGEIKFILYEK